MASTNIRVKWKTFYVILNVIQEKAAVTKKKKAKKYNKILSSSEVTEV